MASSPVTLSLVCLSVKMKDWTVDCEDESGMSLRNLRKYLPLDTAFYPRRIDSSKSLELLSFKCYDDTRTTGT